MLSKKVPTERYSASEALMHPWITRKRNTLIPNKKSVFYTLMNLTHERKLKSAIQVHFSRLVKLRGRPCFSLPL